MGQISLCTIFPPNPNRFNAVRVNSSIRTPRFSMVIARDSALNAVTFRSGVHWDNLVRVRLNNNGFRSSMATVRESASLIFRCGTGQAMVGLKESSMVTAANLLR